MAGITLKETAAASVPTPASTKATVYMDSSSHEPSYKDSGGTTHSLVGATGSTGPTGATGPAGADGLSAYPIDIIDHGSCGATETFDFGDGTVVPSTSGPVHKGTVNADLTFTLATDTTSGQECILTVELVMDGTGGWTVTLPVAVSNASDVEAAIDDTAAASNLLVFRSTDGGSSWIGLRVGPGPAGAAGADGEGVPTGGTTGQVLAKASNTDFDTEWVDPTGGGGSDVVQVASGAGSVTISGLIGDPDRNPGSPDSDDHEFDSSTIGGTALGSPTTIDADTTVPGHLYISKAAGTGENLTGRYWAWTPSAGDILVAKLADHTIRADFASVGLGVCEATPGKVEAVLMLHISGALRTDVTQWSTPTGTSTGIANTSEARTAAPMWFAIRYNSSTSLDYFYSVGGHVWRSVTTARNPGFTVAAFCLFVNPVNSSNDIEAVFDYVRVRSTLIA